MNILTTKIKKIVSRSPRLTKIVRIVNGPQVVCNINYRSEKQKRVLLCYLPQCFEPLSKHVGHSNVLHTLSIVHIFIKLDFCIDVCYSNDVNAFRQLRDVSYSYIFGFGKMFDKISQYNRKAKAVLIVTENDPNIVSVKYKERLDYYKERHPNWKTSTFISRDSFYNKDTFSKYESAIVMSNSFNIARFIKPFKNIYQIDVNGLYNNAFRISIKIEAINDSKNSFLWFGSSGLLHKGLDILIDAFQMLPDLTLDIYGVNTNEMRAIKTIPNNVSVKGKISVYSEEFIKVANSHRYVVSASCSEGMNTGIITCMLHGIIPIVTPETGIEAHNSIIELESFRVEYLVNRLREISNMDDDEVIVQIKNVYDYAQSIFTMDHFSNRFEKIVKDVMIK